MKTTAAGLITLMSSFGTLYASQTNNFWLMLLSGLAMSVSCVIAVVPSGCPQSSDTQKMGTGVELT